MKTPIRYTLLQIPGIAFLAAVMWWLVGGGWLPSSTAVWILGLWLLKDILLYPLYRPALQTQVPVGTAALVGRKARVTRELNPQGQILVRGEHWSAIECRGEKVGEGQTVQVVGARGMILMVERAKAMLAGQ